jgi:tRNA1(Val) A37 N6-methylase TrmN6
VLPIAARRGRAASRILVQARKGRKGAMKILWPFVVHEGDRHLEDTENFTQTARSILRNMVNLPL